LAAAKPTVIRRVFLSSTARDLGPHREAVFKAVSGLDGFQCVRMEDFGARDWDADAFCRDRVAACDVFLGLVGHLYGSSPEGREISFTEREHDVASEAGVPRLFFLASDDLPMPPSLREPDEKWQRQVRFRERLRKERIVGFFDFPDRLATEVVTALRNLEREGLVEDVSGSIAASITTVRVEGSGAAAVGSGALAAGAGGVVVRGDVHGDVIVGGRPERSTTDETATLRTAYLSRLYREAASLSLLGIDPAAAGGEGDAGLSLDAVYTALLTHSPREERQMLADPQERERPLSALEQLNRHQRLVLLGDPGSGKSTFVSFVALCLAGEALGSPHAGLALLRSPLPNDDDDVDDHEEEEEEEPQPWDHGALLPVRVVLRDFAAQGLPAVRQKATARHLWEFIAGTLADASLAGCADFLHKHLQKKGGLILLDGLDEVPEAESRREQIREAVEDFVRTFGKCRVLLTSRTYAYQNQGWKLQGFAEAVLAPFSDGQIERFVYRWYAHSAAVGKLAAADAEGKAAHLREAIFGRAHLRELAGRPLLLTLMACLHAWRGADLPEKREELYAATVELLLDRWENHRVIRDREGKRVLLQPSLGQYLEVGKDKVRQVLEELAFDVHATQGDLPGTADVAEGDLVSRLMRLRRTPETNPAVLVDYLSQRAGLLVPRGVGVYTFPHRTFQEYLAACHLSVEDFPTAIAELGRNDPDRWREVVLLAGAKAARGTPASVWQLARELCYREPDDPESGPADAWGAHLAGQAVAEAVDLSRRISPANQQQLDLLRRWHVHLLGSDLFPARERALAGKTLAKLGDPRFDPERWLLPREPLLGFVEVPAGPFLMGEGKQQHEVTLPAFFIGRFPVTVAQFRAFVEQSGYEVHPLAIEGVANQPATAVSWEDAVAYGRWLTEKLSELAQRRPGAGSEGQAFWGPLAHGELSVALPSEAEWEKAARGIDGREYPWGEEPDPERASYDESGIGEPSTVGCFPRGESPFSCEEMSGNVWEWTRSLWGKDWDKPIGFPYDPHDGREDPVASGPRVLRGGAYFGGSSFVRCAVRAWDDASRDGYVGFRVVLLPFSSDL
jgi:formylglycine-generating enzyme required for sulfatase activity